MHDKKGALDALAKHLGLFNKSADGEPLEDVVRHVVILELPDNGRTKPECPSK